MVKRSSYLNILSLLTSCWFETLCCQAPQRALHHSHLDSHSVAQYLTHASTSSALKYTKLGNLQNIASNFDHTNGEAVIMLAFHENSHVTHVIKT
ncbi:hypothetical protein R3P38DRAFT_3020107 [Favolaschia claudopus]|uniref:Uncharacterized protein n=1 Tax=Favolaschia claudopus TaxID=2862362 RepID=A0AAW0AHQ3_9AGAR